MIEGDPKDPPRRVVTPDAGLVRRGIPVFRGGGERVEDLVPASGGAAEADGERALRGGREVGGCREEVEIGGERAPGKDGLIFTNSSGGPVWRTGFRNRIWEPALRSSGLGRVRFHDLRHTSAGIAIDEGAHPKTIQLRLGHHSAPFTLDTYGGLFAGLDEELADELDARVRNRSKRRKERPADVSHPRRGRRCGRS